MISYEKPSVWVWLLVVILALPGGMAAAAKPAMAESGGESIGLMGEWCREKKRMITQYSVAEGSLFIRGGRSGRTHEAALACNDAYTECKAKTIRGWGTPVTEILRLDGEVMNLTRIWGGAWKDKSYNFTFTRCPKW
ncbi:MAG: hypothetical protein B6D72_08225 [gamma proteobacterium symbiont of Ctena orbiculata]|uniref:Uncharacterized protein n=1 Tax=Candidatus Thiodiazotropha taylori TaxID=2792791 RepID=A0A944QTL4_9GAMM|nr:hypothetical protein [Candidatus Thiodiazotropha taylori]PUB87203.1 MAG: hypothetical protein DBP00_09370 [gamma proteobacterium symbiont of Ctena orbiculata]MBT2989207.1 hypothetical protein [Candidatus Thiodiazotropha taylori]MBT2995582.1 hypothetical protein [Candidatus Thiodiazotropha taylori]MBT2999464.1 hypothetical protein [Candidatus Thiodiazotropha taylori]